MRTCHGVARRAKTDNVLGDALKSLGIIALDRLAVMNASSRGGPGGNPLCFQLKSLRANFFRKKLFVDQHLDDPYPEHLLQRLGAHPRGYVEHTAGAEQPIGYQSVQMTVVSHVFAKCVDGHDHSKLAVRTMRDLPQEFQQALVGNPA